MDQEIQFGPWLVFFDTMDGARISRLAYNDMDILTKETLKFRPPKVNYGKYETRPVYGYDDCFPSVESCTYPDSNWEIPDHGELCWLSWQVKKEQDKLIFSVESKNLPILFVREMHFSENELKWVFKVINNGEEVLPFQHVMHPLMPLDRITELHLPEFNTVFDEINQKILDLKTARSISAFLMSQPAGSTSMLFLRQVEQGRVSWKYDSGLRIEVGFSESMFPSLGIWWNNQAYPDEDFVRRTECALEPIPGANSVLVDAYKNKECLMVAPGKTINWQIRWRVSLDKKLAI